MKKYRKCPALRSIVGTVVNDSLSLKLYSFRLWFHWTYSSSLGICFWCKYRLSPHSLFNVLQTRASYRAEKMRTRESNPRENFPVFCFNVFELNFADMGLLLYSSMDTFLFRCTKLLAERWNVRRRSVKLVSLLAALWHTQQQEIMGGLEWAILASCGIWAV